jgi:hypothetical protein
MIKDDNNMMKRDYGLNTRLDGANCREYICICSIALQTLAVYDIIYYNNIANITEVFREERKNRLQALYADITRSYSRYINIRLPAYAG